jgi:UDP-N-acetylmuramate--alanine ligase
VLCIDDPVVREILPRVSRPVLTYGFSEQADFRISDVSQHERVTTFQVARPGSAGKLAITINMPGLHNVLNATAAIAVATDEGLGDSHIQSGIANFQGVGRRFDVQKPLRCKRGTVMLVDDYGHHPTEVAANIQAIRAGWPGRRLVMVYQPHRFTRTHDLYDDFVEVLGEVDVLLMLEVYAAGEKPISGADSKSLCRSIRQRGKVDPVLVKKHDELRGLLDGLLQDGDILVTQGAGNIGNLCKQLAAEGLGHD